MTHVLFCGASRAPSDFCVRARLDPTRAEPSFLAPSLSLSLSLLAPKTCQSGARNKCPRRVAEAPTHKRRDKGRTAAEVCYQPSSRRSYLSARAARGQKSAAPARVVALVCVAFRAPPPLQHFARPAPLRPRWRAPLCVRAGASARPPPRPAARLSRPQKWQNGYL